MNVIFRIISAAYVSVSLVLPAMADDRVTVFAAASLKTALDEVVARFDGAISVSYGGSGVIARQVAAGAPADVVILANSEWMDWLAGQGVLDANSRVDLLSNRLVLAGPVGAATMGDISDLPARLGNGRLAMGQRNSVPAGIYARQWLEVAGLWPVLHDRLAETENVRAALALISRGEVPIGIVYATDAAADASVEVLYEVPNTMHDPILYPAARVANGTLGSAAFFEHLVSDASRAIFAANGFVMPGTAQ